MKLVLESMFFILFGITFLFILLLIYHFKNKINALEKNVDTMFEILNNVVTDLSYVKASQHSSRAGGMPDIPHIGAEDTIVLEEEQENANYEDEEFENANEEEDDDELTEEEEESEGEEESDEESEEEESEDEEESDEESEEEIENVKTISINLDEKLDESVIEAEEILVTETEENENESVPELKEVETINVEKIEEQSVQSVELEREDKMQQYKKMHIQNLKKLVMSKGLAEDVSKLKKADLLVILQEE